VALFQEAMELTGARPLADDTDVAAWHQFAHAEWALLIGDPAGAVSALVSVYRARIDSQRWWERADALRAAVALGQAEVALGHADAGIRYLEGAVAGYPAVCAINEDFEHRRHLARAQRVLAELLRRLGRDPDRAAGLQRTAEQFYRTAGYP
jgi:hypothetical protein